MESKLTKLARLVLPTSEYINNTNLFLNYNVLLSLFNGCLKTTYEYKFNTWMNMFAIKKYCQYCNIEDLFLTIQTDCDCKILIYNINYNESLNCNEEVIDCIDIKGEEINNIKIEKPEKYENLYFAILSDRQNIKIKQASWATSTPAAQKNKLAIITCTFKREDFVCKNVKLIKEFIENNPEIKGRVELFVVDNGRTLNSNIESDCVKLFPNKNVGGAGGFTRGIIEALKDSSISRVLLMDDDVEVFGETLYRTLLLLDHLKPEYEKAFVHGAMLNLFEKNMFFESTATQTVDWCESFHGELDISEPFNVVRTNYTPNELFENKDKKVSSAWWYCCFSVKSVKEKGLPLPVFFRCDDIEWSWRNFPEHHITINGISVWHSPFEWRVSKPVQYYFSKRNSFYVNILHTPNYKKKMLKILKADFETLIATYDYSSCAIYLKMMSDILEGSKIFEQNQENILKELSGFAKADEICTIQQHKAYLNIKEKYKQFKNNERNYHKSLYKLKKLLYKITLKGKLVPSKLYKKKKDVWLYAPICEFFFTKKLNVYNFGLNKIEIRKFNPKKSAELTAKFKKLHKKISKHYSAIENDYKCSLKKFVGIEFWNKYLEIGE